MKPSPSLTAVLFALAIFGHAQAADTKKKPVAGPPPSPPKVVDALIATFSSLDFDGNGTLDFGEFTATARYMQGAAERAFRNVDLNRNRAISIQEFANSRSVRLPAGTKNPVDPVKQEFRRLDGDGDANGVVSIEEIALAMTFPSGEALDAYFAGLDTDGSEGVSLDEWRAGYGKPVVVLKPDNSACPGGNPAPYIGKTLDEVRALLNGRAVRVVKLDGVELGRTLDYNPCRLNLEVEKGVVKAGYGG
jgi:hypothetical protein